MTTSAFVRQDWNSGSWRTRPQESPYVLFFCLFVWILALRSCGKWWKWIWLAHICSNRWQTRHHLKLWKIRLFYYWLSQWHTLIRLFGDYTLGRKEKNKHGPKWLRAKGLTFHIFVVSLVICLAKSRNHQKSLPFFFANKPWQSLDGIFGGHSVCYQGGSSRSRSSSAYLCGCHVTKAHHRRAFGIYLEVQDT